MTRTIVITGGSDGIGAAAARQLTRRGERVVVVGRSPAKTAAVGRELGIDTHVCDYADLSQVRRLAEDLASAYPRIDVLANNAGGVMADRKVTTDGFELTFQVNHLAGFLLTHLLLPTLTASSATVIQTSSIAARVFSRFDIDDLQNERRYSPQSAYGNGKLENILFTRELQRRYGDRGINAAAFHPGVVGSNFAADSTFMMGFIYKTPVVRNILTISPDKGADQLVWLAESTPGRDWRPGRYYEKRKAAKSATAASDDDLARRLWEQSCQLVGVSD